MLQVHLALVLPTLVVALLLLLPLLPLVPPAQGLSTW
jgi:hypothetical protein